MKRLLHCAATGFYLGCAIVAAFAGEAVFLVYAGLMLGHGAGWLRALYDEAMQEMADRLDCDLVDGTFVRRDPPGELATLLEDLDRAFQEEIQRDLDRLDERNRAIEKEMIEAFLAPGDSAGG